jgi:hypothetical protein
MILKKYLVRFILSLFISTILFGQINTQVQSDTTERYAKIVTLDSKNTMLYDSTQLSKSDAYVIVALLEREGIWSPRVWNANAIFAINNKDVYWINLFVEARALSSAVGDSILKNILYDLKSVYPERQYEFELMSIDSTFSVITKEIKIE